MVVLHVLVLDEEGQDDDAQVEEDETQEDEGQVVVLEPKQGKDIDVISAGQQSSDDNSSDRNFKSASELV